MLLQLLRVLYPVLPENRIFEVLYTAELICQLPGFRHKPPGDLLPPCGREQCLKNLRFFPGAGQQQPQKLSLRQHNNLGELLASQAQKPLGSLPDTAFRAGDQQRPGFLPPLVAGMLLPAFQLLCSPALIKAAAAAKTVALPPECKFKFHQGFLLRRRPGGPHTGPASPSTGGAAVKREAHRVQQRRLTAARRPADKKNPVFPEPLKIDLRAVDIGAKGLQRQFQRLHASSSSQAFIICTKRSWSSWSASMPQI